MCITHHVYRENFGNKTCITISLFTNDIMYRGNIPILHWHTSLGNNMTMGCVIHIQSTLDMMHVDSLRISFYGVYLNIMTNNNIETDLIDQFSHLHL